MKEFKVVDLFESSVVIDEDADFNPRASLINAILQHENSSDDDFSKKKMVTYRVMFEVSEKAMLQATEVK